MAVGEVGLDRLGIAVQGVAIAACTAGVAADQLSFAQRHALGIQAADHPAVPGFDDHLGWRPVLAAEQAQAGLPEGSNHRLISVSVVVVYSRMPLPPRHLPGPAESWR